MVSIRALQLREQRKQKNECKTNKVHKLREIRRSSKKKRVTYQQSVEKILTQQEIKY